MGGLIFISCGQVTPEEKKLGAGVCALVRELTPHQAYFAENQSSLDAFTKNILGALDNAVGLVAIMHPRGIVKFPDGTERVRASVWIEQEIAMGAFITQILGRPLKIAPYIHAGIPREGVREQLQLNAVTFTSDNEVLEHLRQLLPTWKGLPNSLKRVAPPYLGLALKNGTASNFLFEYTNEDDEEVSILRVILKSKGVELTDPLTPERGSSWTVPPHSSRQFGKSLSQGNPAVRLARMNENEGIFFNTDLDVFILCSTNSGEYEISKRLPVRVQVTNNQITQL